MKPSLPAMVCRVLVAMAISLGVIIAPALGRMNCDAASVPADCHCCKNPQQGCCASEQNAPSGREPVPALPPQTGLKEMAESPASVIAILPAIASGMIWEIVRSGAEHMRRVSAQLRFCIRMV